MTIDRKSDLARAYRIARRGRRGGGLLPAGQALQIARGMVAAPATIYGGDSHWVRFHGFPGNRGRDEWNRYHAAEDCPAFRDETPAHDVTGGPDHRGWYDNPYSESFRDGSGLCFGVVVQIPGRDGSARYLAGFRFGGHETGPTIDLGTVYTAPGEFNESAMAEAARAADSMAETAAETEREYQTAWAAGNQWAEAGERIAEITEKARVTLRENRESGGSRDLPAIHATIREAVCAMRAEVQELRQKRAELAAGERESLWWHWGRYDESPLTGFAEGAGLDLETARAVCS